MQKQKPIDAFKSGGNKPGLEIWVVRVIQPPQRTFPMFNAQQQNQELEYEAFQVSPIKHGIFYIEDLYVILKTSEDQQVRNIHFWIGKSYSDPPPPWLDKFEDLELPWKATQHFEFQGLECELFESYFQGVQPAIRYKRGRHPDPFAEKSRGETRFYKLERLDKIHYRVREIPFNIALMTKEECFILDTDFNTRSYVSDRTTDDERNKSIVVANRIRELDHEGNGDIEVVDLTTFSNEADREKYVKQAKISKEKEEPPPAIDFDQPDEDLASPQVQMHMITLLSSEDADIGYPPRFRYVPKPKKSIAEEKELKIGFYGRFKRNFLNCLRSILGRDTKKVLEYEIPALEEKFVKSVVQKPFKKEDLNSKKCYLLQGAPGQGVIVWVGASCDADCKTELTECLRLEIKRCEEEQTHEQLENKIDLDDTEREVYYKKDAKKDDSKSPQWTHAIKVTEGNEPVKFKKYFLEWQ